ncbi:MAG: enoyl-CoA hydratase/isomerase family protein [Pseudomonadota bacterium]
MNFDYQLLQVDKLGALANVTIDNPPVNIITGQLFAELAAVFEELDGDSSLAVVVVKSANPDFFLAHFDVEILLQLCEGEASAVLNTLADYQTMLRRIREMDKVVIGQIEGRVGGGGAELSMHFDMRFGVKGKTKFNQMEVPLGILPGGSGTQMLPRLVGHARAMEVIMGAEDIDAATAESWGLLNRALDSQEIDEWVQRLARRIAGWPLDAIRKTKQSINNATLPLAEGLAQEGQLFTDLLLSESARVQMSKFMRSGGQTSEGELRIAELSAQLSNNHDA